MKVTVSIAYQKVTNDNAFVFFGGFFARVLLLNILDEILIRHLMKKNC